MVSFFASSSDFQRRRHSARRRLSKSYTVPRDSYVVYLLIATVRLLLPTVKRSLRPFIINPPMFAPAPSRSPQTRILRTLANSRRQRLPLNSRLPSSRRPPRLSSSERDPRAATSSSTTCLRSLATPNWCRCSCRSATLSVRRYSSTARPIRASASASSASTTRPVLKRRSRRWTDSRSAWSALKCSLRGRRTPAGLTDAVDLPSAAPCRRRRRSPLRWRAEKY